MRQAGLKLYQIYREYTSNTKIILFISIKTDIHRLFKKTDPVVKIYFHPCNDKEMLDIHLITLVNFVTSYLFDYCGEQHVLFG